MKLSKINIDFKVIPKETYFSNKKYVGEVVFINGYNGYSKTNDDSIMCGLINNSAFSNGKPNILFTKNNVAIHSENRRGQNFNV